MKKPADQLAGFCIKCYSKMNSAPWIVGQNPSLAQSRALPVRAADRWADDTRDALPYLTHQGTPALHGNPIHA